MVVCAGGNQDLPVIDITRSSRWSYKSRRKFTQWRFYQNWIDFMI